VRREAPTAGGIGSQRHSQEVHLVDQQRSGGRNLESLQTPWPLCPANQEKRARYSLQRSEANPTASLPRTPWAPSLVVPTAAKGKYDRGPCQRPWPRARPRSVKVALPALARFRRPCPHTRIPVAGFACAVDQSSVEDPGRHASNSRPYEPAPDPKIRVRWTWA